MSGRCFRICWVIGFFTAACLVVNAQEVVHALSGTVKAINPSAKTIIIQTNDGSYGHFKELTKSHVSLLFDRDIRSHATPAEDFKDKGAQVIVYYFGGGFGTLSQRTAVALRNLGPGPLEDDTGTVVNFNKHELTIKTGKGSRETFQIGDNAVADTSEGAVSGDKFDPEKGDQVRVIAAIDKGSRDLLFVRSE